MQHDEGTQLSDPPPQLWYAAPERRTPRLGIVSFCCSLVSPCVYLLIIVLGGMNLHPGNRAAVTMALVATASAIAGLCLSVLSLRHESGNNWARFGSGLSFLALCFNCIALAHSDP